MATSCVEVSELECRPGPKLHILDRACWQGVYTVKVALDSEGRDRETLMPSSRALATRKTKSPCSRRNTGSGARQSVFRGPQNVELVAVRLSESVLSNRTRVQMSRSPTGSPAIGVRGRFGIPNSYGGQQRST